MSDFTGAQLAIQALADKGVRYVFTLSGGHITPLHQHMDAYGVSIFDTRHEQAAVFMAEAWGKMTRKPAVAMVTAGPGFTNALTGVASASFSNTPVVLIAGSVGLDNREKLDLQDMPQEPVIAPLVKKTFVCTKANRAYEYVDMAFRTAMGGRPGPVYLEFPVDILNNPVPQDEAKKITTTLESEFADTEKAATLIELISSAHKPVIIAGTGIWQANAEKELVEFADKTGIPVFTSLGGRGTIPDSHPLCFEGALAIRPGASLHAYMVTDLLIIFGTRISLFYMFGDIFNPAAKIVQIDICAEEIGRNRQVDLPVVSDLKAFLRACNKTLAEKDTYKALPERFTQWISELEKASAESKSQAEPNWTSNQVPIHPMRLAKEVDQFMNRPDDIVVADGGDTTTWIGMTRTVNRAGHYLDYGLFGSLAVGIPYANAAKLLYPDKRVLLLTGDGSVGFNFMEFETAIRKKLPIVVVICNDQGWGMIRHSQEIRIGKAIEEGTWIGNIHYHKMVEALGGTGILVESPDEIRPALEAAFASGKTACINVMCDTTAVSPASMALANVGAYKAS